MDFSNEQKHSLLAKMGYTGSMQNDEMEAFIQSNPGVAAKMGKFSRAMKRGFAAGGSTSKADKNPDTTATKPNTIPKSPTAAGGGTSTSGGANPGGTTPKLGTDKVVGAHIITEQKDGKTVYVVIGSGGNRRGTFDTQEKAQARLQQLTAPKQTAGETLADVAVSKPEKLVEKPKVATVTASPNEFIKAGTGQVKEPVVATTETVGTTETAAAPQPLDAATYDAVTTQPQAEEILSGVEAQQGEVSPEALVTAAQQTESSISDMQAAQGEAYLMDNPVQREIQAGELISGSAVDAAKVEQLNSSIQAAEATPSEKATVQGQLEGLMQQFEGGNTPAWAAGAMRNAQAMLAQRGLGASSIAGQAVIQAAMESALPIAQTDAATFAQFEAQNLSNRQQAAMVAAQYRAQFLQMEFDQNFQTRVLNASKISDIANMNFTAEQQIALENSRAANSMNLANLDARQAMVMAQAAALSNLDMANLNNRQQAAMQNAQSFLQMDMANLDNRQQTEIFKAQSNLQALFTDAAARNAALQFNAASENQTNQFFADLSATVSRFNAEQKNAMAQFNAGERNTTTRLNAQLEARRQEFNANNSLIIAQANAKWRQEIKLANTENQHEANLQYARDLNNMTALGMEQIWQKERDQMAFSFTAAESALDREFDMLMADKNLDAAERQNKIAERQAKWYTGLKVLFDW